MHRADTFTFNHFSFGYQEELLYDNFSLTIPKNQWLGILGPSGVGKSTLLHAIGRFIQKEFPELHLAVLPQQNTLLPWLNVIDNICVGNLLRDENKKDCAALLEKLGLTNLAAKYPCKLSGGQAQRVIIARTLYEKSDIILMDEPFVSLDAITKQHAQDVAHQAFQNKTVILVTHDPLEALRLCDQVIVLQGKPVFYENTLTLNSNAPRKLDDQEVVLYHELLMEKLKNATKMFA